MGKQGNRYGEEFKADIIRLIISEKQPLLKVAKDFGVNDQTIRNWLKSADKNELPGDNRITELETQLKEEKRRNADLHQTVNIIFEENHYSDI